MSEGDDVGSRLGPAPPAGRAPDLESIIQALPVSVLVVDSRGSIVMANSQAERLFGYVSGGMIGMEVERLVPPELRDGHAGYRLSYGRAPESRRMGAGRDLTGLRKDGSRVPVEIGLSPLQSGGESLIVASIVDITERKRSEAAVRERDELLRAVMDNSAAVIYMKDREGRYLMINRRYQEIFGVTNEGLRGRTDLEIFPPELAGRFRANDSLVIERMDAMQFEEAAPHADGIHAYVSVKFPLLAADGSVYGMCGISTDVTELRRLERELAHTEKLTALGQLAAGVAHEINTPLTNILLVAESLMRRSSDPVTRTKLETIVAQVETSSRIVKGLLDFARKKEPAFGRVDLAQTVRDTILFIQGKAPSDVEFLLETLPEPVEVEGDSSQLTQVFANIALNAIEAMGGRGRVTFRVSKESIREEEGPARDHGVVVIEDEGPGISEVVKERIFEPFFTTKGERGGTGLGLSVVYGIVRAHHGSIEASNRREGGARFRIVLPFARPAEAGAAA
jgi:PAS domain S-box-containing protein